MALLKLALLLGVATLANAAANTNITSPIITNWGTWGSFEHCPNGRQAQGFQLRTEPNQFLGDDTALNAIRLFCGDPFLPDTAVITSTVGEFGSWGHVYTCFPSVITAFQLRSESDRGSGDNTAANNVRFTCSDNPNDYIQGDGTAWGDWTSPQYCQSGQAICGIQTQVQPYQSGGDDTSLNNVRMECCDYQRSDLQAGYDYVAKNGAYPQAMSPEFAELLRKAVADEMNNSTDSSNSLAKLKIAMLVRGKVGVHSSIQTAESQTPKKESVLLRLSATLKNIEQARSNGNEPSKARVSVLAKMSEALKTVEKTKSAEKKERVSVFANVAEALKKIQMQQPSANNQSQPSNQRVSIFAQLAEIAKKIEAEQPTRNTKSKSVPVLARLAEAVKTIQVSQAAIVKPLPALASVEAAVKNIKVTESAKVKPLPVFQRVAAALEKIQATESAKVKPLPVFSRVAAALEKVQAAQPTENKPIAALARAEAAVKKHMQRL